MSSISAIETQEVGLPPSAVMGSQEDKRAARDYRFVAIVGVGIFIRLLVLVLAGGGARTPWGGGGDTPAYLLLARNLVAGKGYAYAGEPTALRAPMYPLLLAGWLSVFPAGGLLAMRCLQFFQGLAAAFLCAATAGKIFGPEAKRATLVISLLYPTMVVMSGEILTEATATFCSAIFLYLFVCFWDKPRWITLAGLSATAGLGALVRFNMALLGVLVLLICFLVRDRFPVLKSAGFALIVMTLLVSPWLIRNEFVFHGQVLFSTHSGIEAVEGVLAPQGRALPGDAGRLEEALGWVAPIQVETNDASRHLLPPEPVLNSRAWAVAIGLWHAQGMRLLPLAIKKIVSFWLSTDQLLSTESFGLKVRAARSAGVLVYWALLTLALAGWLRLRSENPKLASIFLGYAALVTVSHLPFVMNTRLRSPLIDPWTAVLAGAGVALIVFRAAGGKRMRTTAVEACACSVK